MEVPVSMLADLVDHVIGIDPDKETFSVAVIEALSLGAGHGERFNTRPGGYESALEWADTHTVADRRVWAIEGSGTYGAGLARMLRAAGEWVIEFSFPKGPAAPTGAKTDHLDAVRAGREVLGRTSWAQPRNANGHSQAIASIVSLRQLLVTQRTQLINHLKALLVRAPDELRDRLRDLSNSRLIATCARLRPSQSNDLLLDEVTSLKIALKTAAGQIQVLNRDIAALFRRLDAQTMLKAPQLRAERGIGPATAAVVIAAWSHPGRIRSEAAFAALAGTNPIPVESGQKQSRHRLNRHGDRQLNHALYMIVLSRTRTDPETQDFIATRISQGKTPRDARRILKRALARKCYRLLENPPANNA